MKKRPSVFVIFLTVFIDLIGFGMVVPLVPIYSKHYGAGAIMLGVVGASFSAMQFIFSPIWGRLSDRYGRRPILLISTAGATLSYVGFALASGMEDYSVAIWALLASRAFAGMCGGNITVAQAYIADVTPAADRSRRMGLIGMAFGLGFLFGPVISWIGLQQIGDTGPGWLAAGLCALNFVLAYLILGESLKPNSDQTKPRPRWEQWRHTLTHPQIGTLVIIFFFATFCFSCFEFTLGWLINDNFHLGLAVDQTKSATTVVSLFIYCALIGVVVQGGAIGKLVKLMGEAKLIVLSLFLTGASFLLLPFIKGDGQLSWNILFRPEGVPWLMMLFALALLVVGTNLTRPPLFGMLSNLAPPTEQGATIGVAQSAGSLARILGPFFAALVYHRSQALPYLICGGIALLTGVFAILWLRTPAGSPQVAD